MPVLPPPNWQTPFPISSSLTLILNDFEFDMEKEKLRTWICFSCCFNACGGADDSDGERPATLLRSSSTWLRTRVPEIGERWRGLIGRRRRIAGGDFSYDPLSYALNFDEGIEDGGDLAAEGFRYRSFSSRLPASPSPSG